jgi:hypothetical protein
MKKLESLWTNLRASGTPNMVLDHEMSHVQQGMIVSVGYLFAFNISNLFTFFGACPWAMASSVVISGAGTGFKDFSTHGYDVLECPWIAVPACE